MGVTNADLMEHPHYELVVLLLGYRGGGTVIELQSQEVRILLGLLYASLVTEFQRNPAALEAIKQTQVYA